MFLPRRIFSPLLYWWPHLLTFVRLYKKLVHSYPRVHGCLARALCYRHGKMWQSHYRLHVCTCVGSVEEWSMYLYMHVRGVLDYFTMLHLFVLLWKGRWVCGSGRMHYTLSVCVASCSVYAHNMCFWNENLSVTTCIIILYYSSTVRKLSREINLHRFRGLSTTHEGFLHEMLIFLPQMIPTILWYQ